MGGEATEREKGGQREGRRGRPEGGKRGEARGKQVGSLETQCKQE